MLETERTKGEFEMINGVKVTNDITPSFPGFSREIFTLVFF